MAGLASGGTSARPGIIVNTSRGRDIGNDRGVPPSVRDVQAFHALCQRRLWQPRRSPTGEYNCAGLVWASRRTNIYEQAEWDKILRDDSYRAIQRDSVEVGDLALYMDGTVYLHVGLVVRFDMVDTTRIPWLLSKLSPASGEVIHRFNDHPAFEHFSVAVQFLTDRP